MKQHYTGRICYIVRFIPREGANDTDYLIDCYETGFPNPLTKYQPSEFSKGCPPIWNDFDVELVTSRKFFDVRDCYSLIKLCTTQSFYEGNRITLEEYKDKPQRHYACDPYPIYATSCLTQSQLNDLLSVFEEYTEEY